MRKLAGVSSLSLSLIVLAAAAGCGRGPERAPAPAPAAPGTASAPTTGSVPPSTQAPGAPPPADMASAAEMRREISTFVLTDKTVDGIMAVEKDLGDFWSNPEEARKIRTERSLPKILAAIDASPRLSAVLKAHGMTGREYILGSFTMIAGYIWEKAREQQPQQAAGQKAEPPVNAASLAVVKTRMADVTKLLSPPPDRQKSAPKKKPSHPEMD